MDLISVVVCTYNRSASLAETLARLADLQADDTFAVEVVVVDNNSRDDTRAVVESCMPRFGGRLRYVFEARQGQSHARNTGMREARGLLVVFTDDDVLPSPNWLIALRAAAAEFSADCVFGRVMPLWLSPPPKWMGAYFLDRLAMLDRGDEARLVSASREQFVGANFALTRHAISIVGEFNTALGNCGNRLSGEEDTEFFDRLLAAGVRVAYTPAAVVQHKVDKDRTTLAYFRRWHFDHGMASAQLVTCAKGRSVGGLPFWVLRNVLRHLGGWAAGLVSGGMERRLTHEMRLIFYLGLVAGRLRPGLSRAPSW
jgi:glycosyltransferase involved in cell wall biosynthesis